MTTEKSKDVDVIVSDAVDVVDEATRANTGDVAAAIVAMNTPGNSAIYSSIVGDSFEARKSIVNAMTTSEPIDEHLGEVIRLANYVIQAVTLLDDEGQSNVAPRVILIDEDGTAYHGTSVGLFSSLQNLSAILGEPATWPEAVEIAVAREKTRKGFQVFTIRLV